MKKEKALFILLGMVIISFVLLLFSNHDDNKTPKAITPTSAKELKNEKYTDVENLFEEAGFENISTKEEADLKIGLFADEGDVKSVSISGDTDFKKGDSFDRSSQVLIIYHVFPTVSSDTTVATKDSQEALSSSIEASSSEEIKVDDTIITAENNSDFAHILSSNNDQQAYITFADTFKGRKIAFDGNIASIAKHGSNNTRYDILIYGGDYSTTSAQGVSFQLKDKNLISDLRLTGDNIPDSITVGLNIHLIATIDSYNSTGELMLLTPIETRIR